MRARLRSDQSEDDSAWLEMVSSSGTHVQSFFSLVASDDDRVEIHGSAGRLLADRYAGTVEQRAAEFAYARGDRFASVVRSSLRAARSALGTRGEPSYRGALSAFISAARGGPLDPGAARVDDGVAAFCVVEAAERSASSGRAERVAPSPEPACSRA